MHRQTGAAEQAADHAASCRRRLSRVTATVVGPALIGGALLATAPSAGAATVVGTVTAWGNDGSGQTNVPAAAQSGVKAIAAGMETSYALKTDGSLIGWGTNSFNSGSVPAAAQSGVAAVDAEGGTVVALKTDGTVVSWGGASTTQAGPSAVTQVAASSFGAMALKSDHTIQTWGPNISGENNVPAAVQGHAVDIDGGSLFNAAVTDTGSVVTWGSANDFWTVVPQAAKTGVVKVVVHNREVAAIKRDGSVVIWGIADFGATPAAAASGVVDVALGDDFAIALKADGSLVHWGPGNADGQQNIPATAAAGVSGVAAGNEFAMALHVPLASVPPVINGTPPPAVLGQPYNFTVSLAGSFDQVTAGTLPAGLDMDNTGQITGTPTRAGRTTVTVTTTTLLGSSSAPLTITVQPGRSATLQFINPPASVQTGALESDQYVRSFAERYNQTLSGNLTVGGTTVPAGTKVNVYYLHADHIGSDNVAHTLSGSEWFGSTVLATATTAADLQATTALFGAPGTAYSTSPDQGLEFDDSATRWTDQTGVNYTLNSWNASDAVRVITLAP